jgi:hypothetical protein
MSTQKTLQRRWTPGFDNDERSLASVYRDMPRDPASSIPWYVWLLENPNSPCALSGSVDLFGHDCIHIVLGRGLLQQDEAFVLGFTMGSSRCPRWQAKLFLWCARHVYRGAFRFSPADCDVYEQARRAAQQCRTAPLQDIDFRSWLERPLGELRNALGIDTVWLRAVYARETRRDVSRNEQRTQTHVEAVADAEGGLAGSS